MIVEKKAIIENNEEVIKKLEVANEELMKGEDKEQLEVFYT